MLKLHCYSINKDTTHLGGRSQHWMNLLNTFVNCLHFFSYIHCHILIGSSRYFILFNLGDIRVWVLNLALISQCTWPNQHKQLPHFVFNINGFLILSNVFFKLYPLGYVNSSILIYAFQLFFNLTIKITHIVCSTNDPSRKLLWTDNFKETVNWELKEYNEKRWIILSN